VARARVAPFAAGVLGAIVALAVWTVACPNGGGAATTPSLVERALSAVQTPSQNEFPTIPSAIDYLVEQVRTQDLDAATRVLPIADLMRRATFTWEATRLQSVTVSGSFPKQPFSMLYEQLGLLERDYVLFAVDLLHPGFTKIGTLPLSTPAAERQFEAQLDPARLSHLAVKAIAVGLNTARVSGLGQIGVTRVAEATVRLTGVGRPRNADVMLYRIGSNWLVSSVQLQ
jgi:hypothetical protein